MRRDGRTGNDYLVFLRGKSGGSVVTHHQLCILECVNIIVSIFSITEESI